MLRSKYSGSWSRGGEEPSSRGGRGLAVGEITGDVCKSSGISSDVSKTKKASPPSPSFIA